MALASPSGRLFTSGAAKPGEESSKIQIVNAAPDKRAFLGSLGVEAKSDEIPAYPVLTRLVIGSETLKRGRTFCLPLAGLCAIILEKVGDMAASGKKPFSNFFPDSERDYPGPLANPVLHEICGDTNGIKFGFESLINAVLADSGDQPIAKVTKVKPQQVQSGKGERTYRVDVAVSTKDNEIIVVEAQLYKFADMDARAMLYIQEYLDIGSKKGESLEDVIKKIPRIIFVGLLDFVFRQSGENYHQVVERTFREDPRDVPEHPFPAHYIQLPKFQAIEPDYNNPLHCWLLTLNMAQKRQILMKEVVMGNTNLKAFYDSDQGFRQFVDRHGLVARDPEILKEYHQWQIESVLLADEIKRREDKGIAKGKVEGKVEIALKAFQVAALSGEDFSIVAQRLSDYGIEPDIIRTARTEAESQQSAR